MWYYDPYEFEKEFNKLQEMLFKENLLDKNIHLENTHYSFPSVNVFKKKIDEGMKYYVYVLLPGYKKDEIKVEVIDKNTLQISGSKKIEQDEDVKTEFIEFKYIKKFSRKIVIPNIHTDTIDAKLENGILKIELLSGKRINKEKIEIR